jgi:tetratricopeptide (TPR) repeat protein
MNTDKSDSSAMITEGIGSLTSFKTEAALEKFRVAFSIDPNPVYAGWLAIGLAISMADEEARELLATYSGVDGSELLIARALLLPEGEKYRQQKIDLYSAAIEFDSSNFYAYCLRSGIYAAQHNEKAAIADGKSAIRHNRGPYTLSHLGFTYSQLNEYALAIIALTQAIEEYPGFAPAWHQRGRAHFELGEYSKTIQDANRAIELDPSIASCYDLRARTRWLDDKVAALADFDRAIKLGKNDEHMFANRGFIRFNLDDTDGALQDFAHSISINPNFSTVYDYRARLWKTEGNYDRAILDRAKYYELVGIPKYEWADPDDQRIFDTLHAQFCQSTQAEMEANNERLIDYWEALFYWGDEEIRSLAKDRPMRIQKGIFGYGYLCLSDKYLRISITGSLHKYAKKHARGAIGKILQFLMSNLDLRFAERNNRSWILPFQDIGGLIYSEDEGMHLISSHERWLISPKWEKEDYIMAAIELARSGRINSIPSVEQMRIKPKSKEEERDIFESIERLGSLRAKGLINDDEFDQKKRELLNRL